MVNDAVQCAGASTEGGLADDDVICGICLAGGRPSCRAGAPFCEVCIDGWHEKSKFDVRQPAKELPDVQAYGRISKLFLGRYCRLPYQRVKRENPPAILIKHIKDCFGSPKPTRSCHSVERCHFFTSIIRRNSLTGR